MGAGGRKARKVYIGKSIVLVPHPENERFYYAGHISMAFVDCPRCGAPPMKPCIHTDGNVMPQDGHHERRTAYQNMLSEGWASLWEKRLKKPPRPRRITEFPTHLVKGKT